MKITMPARADGAQPAVIDSTVNRTIVVVGANGAGKTRFVRNLAATLGTHDAWVLSALDALYTNGAPDPEHSAIDALHQASPALSRADKSRPQSRLERLLALLMADELVNLLAWKVATARDDAAVDAQKTPGQPPATRLDSLIELWHQIFPLNRLAVDGGRFVFARSDSDDTYGAHRLSDGERAVLYYAAAMLYAPKNAVIIAESPEMFLHPSTMQAFWNRLELMRPDCTMVYATHDLEFAASRRGAAYLWVRACDNASHTWDYELLPDQSALSAQVYMAILGARKPVLFIEGDDRSIDARLYPLIFTDCTVTSLGSCNKVIESTRTFNDLARFHHMQARGIVDRDRRDQAEVDYLRGKSIMVPDVAEIENMLMLEPVVAAVAAYCRRDVRRVTQSVKKSVVNQFRSELRAQALMHTRHRVKRTIECRIDGRFADIGALETHLRDLPREINPRGLYEGFCREFRSYLAGDGDYAAILRVFNQKSMLPASNVAGLCGLADKKAYINTVMRILRTNAPQAEQIRRAVRLTLQAS